MRWVGVVLFTASGVLRLWPAFVLAPRFSGLVASQQGHTLLTHATAGIRNPSYLGLVVTMLGWALTFRSGPGKFGTHDGKRFVVEQKRANGFKGLPRRGTTQSVSAQDTALTGNQL